MFGRAGRPQFDTQGYVYALAHEDDVRLARWKQQYDQIPETTKDPNLIRARKALKKKMPQRREGVQYWNEAQFQKLLASPPAKLASRGELPWRLLAYLLTISPDVAMLRKFVHQRLLDDVGRTQGVLQLHRMLQTLWTAGYIDLQPAPPGELKRERGPLIPPLSAIPPQGEMEPPPTPAVTDEFGVGLGVAADEQLSTAAAAKAAGVLVGVDTEASVPDAGSDRDASRIAINVFSRASACTRVRRSRLPPWRRHSARGTAYTSSARPGSASPTAGNARRPPC